MSAVPRPPGSWRRILGSLGLAVLLTQAPWSGWALLLRPDFMLIAALFWTLYQPARVGFGTAFVLGLLADFQDGAVFGQHGIAYVCAVYLVLFLRLRLLRFAPLQQAAQLFPVLFAAQLLVLLVGWLAASPPDGLALFLPAFSGTILWFVLALTLRAWRGKAMQETE